MAVGRSLHDARHGQQQLNGTNIFFETPVNIWNLWWFRYALIELGQSPFDGSHIFYPHGADLWFHTLALYLRSSALSSRRFSAWFQFYNTLVIASFIAAGLSAAALARELGVTPSRWHAGRRHLRVLPCGRRTSLCGSLRTVVDVLDSSDASRIPPCRRSARRPRLDSSGGPRSDGRSRGTPLLTTRCTYRGDGGDGGGAVAGAVASPRRSAAGIGRWHNDRRRRANGVRFLGAEHRLGSEATCVRIFVTSASSRWHSLLRASHPLFSAAFKDLQSELNGGLGLPQEVTGYLGISVIGLLGAGVFAWRRRDDRAEGPTIFDGRLALAIAASFLVLSLGSELKFRGNPTGLSLPAALFAHVPIVRLARAPGRQMVVAMLGVAVPVAAGWDRIARRTWRAILVAAVVFDTGQAFRSSARAFLTCITDSPVNLVRSRCWMCRSARGTAAVSSDGQVRWSRWRNRCIRSQSSEEWLRDSPRIAGSQSLSAAHRALPRPMRKTYRSRKRKRRYFRRYNIRAIVVHQHATAGERHLIDSLLPIRGRAHFPSGIELW